MRMAGHRANTGIVSVVGRDREEDEGVRQLSLRPSGLKQRSGRETCSSLDAHQQQTRPFVSQLRRRRHCITPCVTCGRAMVTPSFIHENTGYITEGVNIWLCK